MSGRHGWRALDPEPVGTKSRSREQPGAVTPCLL